MKVVALKSFFGAGVNAKMGKTLNINKKLAKAWIKAGYARKANADEAEPAKATTPSTPAPTVPSKTAEDDKLEPTGEVVADKNADGSEPTNGEADKEPTTTGETVTEPTEPQTPPAPAPQNINPNNSKKVK